MLGERSRSYAAAFLRQARADFLTYQHLRLAEEIPNCHQLQFLQMACEKLAKTYLVLISDTPPEALLTHGRIESAFKAMIQFYFGARGDVRGWSKARRMPVARGFESLAREIEALSPSNNKQMEGGQRPDNCEYPWAWQRGGPFVAPVDYSFPLLGRLDQAAGADFLRLVEYFLDLSAQELA
jgi:hypothetical protein